MSEINELNAIAAISGDDKVKVFDKSLGGDAAATMSTIRTFMQEGITANALTIQYASPNVNGFVHEGAGTWLILTPTAGFASGTITLPATPDDGAEFLVNCSEAVTSLTVSATGKTLVGAPTTLTANSYFKMKYNVLNETWYRIG